MRSRFKLLLCVVLLLALSTSLCCLSAAADNIFYLSTAETCDEMIVFQFYRDIVDADYNNAQGTLAPGLVYDYHSTYLHVSGTPTKPGIYSLEGRAITEDGIGEKYSFTIVVQSAGGTEIPVVSEAPSLAPVLTKSPTDETVFEGASAMFIARADEADRIDWYLVEPETYSAFTLAEASSYIEGLRYSGQGTEVLELYNIPLEMDGWQVECLFTNRFGTVMSEPATVHVNELKLETPSIRTQPQSAEKDFDSSVILSVIADNNTEGSELKYQWYMSATGSGNLNPISGANSSSYTPPKTRGIVYYTVAVWSSLEGRDSGKVYSNPAAVTYAETAASPSPSPSPAATPSPAPSLSPSPVQNQNSGTERNGDSGAFGVTAILVVTMLLSAALAVFILVILRKNSRGVGAARSAAAYARPASEFDDEDEEEYYEPVAPKATRIPREWLCSCGALNNSPFCTQCGRARPVLKPCPNCGWMPETPNNIPHFCPECGSPFEEEQD